jgi:hypothetical protein
MFFTEPVPTNDMHLRHRPVLIQSMEAMKCLLDSMLALTKQNRLCHVIHATSDPFYQTWLRQLNIMQHSKVDDQNLSALAFCSNPFSLNRLSPLAIVQKRKQETSSESESCHVYRNDYEHDLILRCFMMLSEGSWLIGKIISPTLVRCCASKKRICK